MVEMIFVGPLVNCSKVRIRWVKSMCTPSTSGYSTGSTKSSCDVPGRAHFGKHQLGHPKFTPGGTSSLQLGGGIGKNQRAIPKGKRVC